MLYAIRFSLSDRPGSLGAVTTALGGLPAGIRTLNVVDTDGRYATDEIVVDAEGCSPQRLRAAIESVPGATVEVVRRVERTPDPLAALALADRLSRGFVSAVEVLVDGLPDATGSSWALAGTPGDPPSVVAASASAPAPGNLETPWLPLEGARRLHAGEWMPTRWRMARFELAAVPLGAHGPFVVVGRPPGMRYRPAELRQLDLLAQMALRAARRLRLPEVQPVH